MEQKPQTAKQWLTSIRNLKLDIRREEGNAKFWESMANKITSNPSVAPGSGSGSDEEGEMDLSKGRVERYGTKAAKCQQIATSRLHKYLDKRADAELAISMLDCPYQKIILTERYLNAKGWQAVAKDVDYEERRMFQVHTKALTAIEPYRHLKSVQ